MSAKGVESRHRQRKGRPRRTALKSLAIPASSEVGVGLVADEAHRGDVGALGDGEHLVDHLVSRLRMRLQVQLRRRRHRRGDVEILAQRHRIDRSEAHTSELKSLMRISYAVFCLKK